MIARKLAMRVPPSDTLRPTSRLNRAVLNRVGSRDVGLCRYTAQESVPNGELRQVAD